MNTYNHFLSIVIAGFLFVGAQAQNASKDLKKMNDAYNELTAFSMKVDYKLYASYTSSELKDSQEGYYKNVKGKNIYTSLSNIETVQNENYLISIDNEDKLIVVSSPIHQSAILSIAKMDTILAHYSTVKFSQPDADTKFYSFVLNKAIADEYSRVDVFIDTKNYYLKKIVLYYKNGVQIDEAVNAPLVKPRLEITYTNMQAKAEAEPILFAESKYFTKKGKKLVPAGKYSKYELINQKIK